MWSYYGSKSKFAEYYPIPKYKTVIEPFAGSAKYSLFGDNWKKQVILIDKYKVITDIWNYLINKATPEMILSLPDIIFGECLDDLPISAVEKKLMGFCINRGCSSPCHYPGKWNSWTKDKVRIANDLFKIKHWKIIEGTYLDAPDIEATWFIDPPYQMVTRDYHSSANKKTIDFNNLSQFCKSRKGQVIVCENMGATWLPFKPLLKFHGQLHTQTEAIWLNNNNGTLLEFASNANQETREVTK